MAGRNLIYCVCRLVVLLAILHTGCGDVVSRAASNKQTRQARRDSILREDAQEVFYNTELKENSGKEGGNQVALNVETQQTLQETGTRLQEYIILRSPPSLDPGNQHIFQTHRNQQKESPQDTTSQLRDVCLNKPDHRGCGTASKRYYFDQTTMECYKFIYGGCREGGNHFETLTSCNMACLGHE
ncbi:unnamed protein product [Candidula unifasciata]|uniref:BPTI/Kunitz inhibitor domain-containing protein n=1 Tax=Candidula unifasciata TaxID=100452 RepID=A0A8S3YYG6_9EUPU|nr:unnamed protein product [Candidula unifasciata]